MKSESNELGGEGQESLFIQQLQNISTYAELEDFLIEDGKKRGYNGKYLMKGIKTAIAFKPKPEQSSFHYMTPTAYESLVAEMRHMDDPEADALIEKVRWIIEVGEQLVSDEQERQRIAAAVEKLKSMRSKKEDESEIARLKEEIKEENKKYQEVKAKDESIQPPKVKEESKKPWWKFWG